MSDVLTVVQHQAVHFPPPRAPSALGRHVIQGHSVGLRRGLDYFCGDACPALRR